MDLRGGRCGVTAEAGGGTITEVRNVAVNAIPTPAFLASSRRDNLLSSAIPGIGFISSPALLSSDRIVHIFCSSVCSSATQISRTLFWASQSCQTEAATLLRQCALCVLLSYMITSSPTFRISRWLRTSEYSGGPLFISSPPGGTRPPRFRHSDLVESDTQPRRLLLAYRLTPELGGSLVGERATPILGSAARQPCFAECLAFPARETAL